MNCFHILWQCKITFLNVMSWKGIAVGTYYFHFFDLYFLWTPLLTLWLASCLGEHAQTSDSPRDQGEQPHRAGAHLFICKEQPRVDLWILQKHLCDMCKDLQM